MAPRPIGLPTSLGLTNPQPVCEARMARIAPHQHLKQQAPISYMASTDSFGRPSSAGSHHNLQRPNDLAMLQQQLQGLSVTPTLSNPHAFDTSYANNQMASAQALTRVQQQQQQTQLLAAQLQATAAATNNLSTLQINALRQTLAVKQQAAMQQRPAINNNVNNNAMAVIAEASRIAALRAQQQQLAQAMQGGGAPSTMHAATIQSLLAQGHGTVQPSVRPARPAAQQSAQHVHDAHYKDKLVEMGVGLAQNNITIETAINAGLLGGLSAVDVRILAAAHQAETRRQDLARQGAYAAVAGLPTNGTLQGKAAAMPLLTCNLSSASSVAAAAAAAAPNTEPLALFDASKLGTSLFGGACGHNGSHDAMPSSALQQQGYFSFFGNDDEHQAQDDDAKSSANNTTGT